MKRSSGRRKKQHGAALLMLVVSLLLVSSYAWYQTMNRQANTFNSEVNTRLQRAKEALIARAVTDANRPGSLPCPDLITDDNGLNNHPNDGKSDNLTRNDCPSYIGWLPWITLDLPELTDDSGTRLWYVLSRSLRDDDLAQPINSDTPSDLTRDSRGEIAALIIAPGAALNGQTRPSNHPADYLDGSNADADTAFLSGPPGEQFNDRVLALTRQELMSAVEKRVAAEVHRCLEQHATASANTWHDYPWPAPFSSDRQRGKAGSHFGQIPGTQPGPGPQSQLAASTTELQNTRNRLNTSSNPDEQMLALKNLNDNLAYGKTLYDRLYSTAKDLALTAKNSALNFTDLNSSLISANSNGRISATEKKSIQTDSSTANTQLAALQSALIDSGLDAFPDELSSQNLTLQSKIDLVTNSPTASNLGLLKDASNAQLTLFANSHTGNNDLSLSLSNALSSSANAVLQSQNASAAPSDTALLSAALNAARTLKIANEQLQATISGNRIALHPSEISARTAQIDSQLSTFVQAPTTAGSSALAVILSETQAVIERINTTSSHLNPLRSNSLHALSDAISATRLANNWPLIESSTRTAITDANILHDAISNHADNITLESLKANFSLFNAQLNTFNTVVARTQADMVPYAENLRLSAVDLLFWAEIINRHASSVAMQARKTPEASKTQTNAASAYSLAEQTLNSINKSTGSLSKLQDVLDAPTNSSKQSAANTALAETLSQLDKLLQSTTSLGQTLHSSHADAFPMLWYGSRCAFLQPASDSTSWWLANQWANTTFFQISQRTRGSEGKLSVNGQGKYHSVTISAGKAINQQDRSSKNSASFFEENNAAPSRDADASAPAHNFIKHPSSANFNDRLAY